MANTFKIKRRTSGATGAPSALKSGELAHNEMDNIVYIGVGDDGSGNATSILQAGGKGAFVDLTSAQTVAGIKTFSVSPVVPTPANSNQAATKGYVDSAVTAGSVADGDKGDITVSSSGAAWAIDADVVTNAKLANMATASIKGRATAGTGDPEDLTASQAKTLLALDLVDNTSDANKPVSTAQAAADALKANIASPTFTGTVGGITKSMVGLANVDNTADTAKPVSTAQQTALDLKATLASPTFTGTVAGITKSMVGLGSVDNTSDASKPVSTAQAAADALKLNLTGGTLTGSLTLAADPSSALHAATKQYVDGIVAAQDAMVLKGVINCSANPNYPAANAGDTYRVSVAGKIGGGSGPNVEVGDILLCTLDGSAAGTHATVGANWALMQVNIDGAYFAGGTDVALADGGTGSSTAAGARTNLGLGDMAVQNAASVAITGGTINGIILDGGTF